MERCHILVYSLPILRQFSKLIPPVLLFLAHYKVHAVRERVNDTPKNVFCNAKVVAWAK